MDKVIRKPPNPTGRPKGALSKTTAQAKENIICVFNRLNGTAGMAKWAKENQTEFYRMYSRLVPIQANINGTINVNHFDTAVQEIDSRIIDLLGEGETRDNEETITH